MILFPGLARCLQVLFLALGIVLLPSVTEAGLFDKMGARSIPTSDREGSEIQAVIVGILPRCFPESANGSLEIVFRKGSVRLEGGRIDLVKALLPAKDLALRDFGDGVVGDDGGSRCGRGCDHRLVWARAGNREHGERGGTERQFHFVLMSPVGTRRADIPVAPQVGPG